MIITTKTRVKCFFTTIALFISLSNYSISQKLFESSETIEITISTDMETLIKDIEDNNIYHDADLLYLDKLGNPVSLKIKLKTRGHFRKQPSNCTFPPLQMKIEKETATNTIFDGIKKLKLVTHCRKNSKYEQYLLQEYLIYKAYNIFTEYSYRVRLARITYLDMKNKINPVTKFAFFIEPANDMAARNNCKILKAKSVHPDKTNYDLINMTSVFQYMIGNTDWSVATLHNIHLIRENPYTAPISVPYDFDWAGIINAPYAKPAPHLEIETVRERVFRGYCRSEEEFINTFKLFKQNKEKILQLYKNCGSCSDSFVNESIKYIEEFYEIINNQNLIRKEFIEPCRTE